MPDNLPEYEPMIRGHSTDFIPGLIWFTGLSGAGKSTLSGALKKHLCNSGIPVIILDGDEMRSGLCGNLGFSREDRSENIRRITEVAVLFLRAGFMVCAAVIAPYRTDRQAVRARVGSKHYLEVFVKCDLATCEKRDVKGLYQKQRSGEMKDLTGKGSPYENPDRPDLIVETNNAGVSECLSSILSKMQEHGFLKTRAQIISE